MAQSKGGYEMATYRHASRHRTTAHYPGKCEPGSIGSLTCAICAPYYRAELERSLAADEARVARYGRKSCPDCGKVYRVDDTGAVEDHAATCQPITDDQMWA